MRDVMLLFCLSISNLSLFDDTKAISMPEKKAENVIVMRICIRMLMLYVLSMQVL